MITRDTFIRGGKNGLNTMWLLGKVIVPVYTLVVFLSHTGILEWIAELMKPITKIVGLPGEAALVLVIGKVLNIYAAIGAILSLSFNAKEIAIIAIMLTISHSLLVETAVGVRTGIRGWYLSSLRLGVAFITGIVMNLIL